MLDVVEYEQLDACIAAQMEDAEGVEKQITEMFAAYCQRIQENLAQVNQTNRAEDHDEEVEGNPDETATNARTRPHLKNVHKKPIEMQSDISLKEFEIWKRKFSDYLF